MKTPKLHVLPPSQPLPVSLLLAHCWWATNIPATAIYWSGLWTTAGLNRGLCDCRFLFKQLNCAPYNQLFENQEDDEVSEGQNEGPPTLEHQRGWTTLLMYLYLDMNMCRIHTANGNDMDDIKFLLQCWNIIFHHSTIDSFCLFKNPATEVIRLEQDAVQRTAKKPKKSGIWSHCCHGSWSQQLSAVFNQDSGDNLPLWWKDHQVNFPIWAKWHRNILHASHQLSIRETFKHRR